MRLSNARGISTATTGTIVCLAIPGVASADQLFAPSSYRNTPLTANAPVDLLSTAYVSDLGNKIAQIGVHLNYSDYSTPVYTVPATQPTQQVIVDNPSHQTCGYGNPCLIEQWRNVPLPANPVPASGTDGNLVVYQPSTDTLWEFWQFKMVSGQPHAMYGGRMQNVSTNPGYFTAAPGTQFGAAATSIPLLMGLQRISELQAGTINHAVSFSMNTPQQGFRWPAQRGDGTSLLTTVAKEGTCFRFPASLNLASYNLTPYGLTLARAIQQYGMVLTDATTTGVALYGEIATDGTDPYGGTGGILGGLDSSGGGGGVLRNIPWSQLQALAQNTC